MTETVGIVIGTFGDGHWAKRAQPAILSAVAQSTPAQLIYVHAQSLAEARNTGARALDTDWLIFLDADDSLDVDYVKEMLAGTGDLRQPSTLGVYRDGHTDVAPVVIPAKPSILTGNWLVIGTMVRREMFEQAGGFRELEAWEDWDLWVRCIHIHGAKDVPCPAAIYRVGVNDDGRNTIAHDRAVRLFNEIVSHYE